MHKKVTADDFDLDQYVAPLIDGNLPEADQGIFTNTCDSGCAPKPKQQ